MTASGLQTFIQVFSFNSRWGRNAVLLAALALMMLGSLLAASTAEATITSVTPITWNVIGLQSNNVLAGPNRFPVGARVCSDSATPLNNYQVNFVWTSENAYLNLTDNRDKVFIDIPAGGCADAYFEVTLVRNDLAFYTARRYYIQAGDPPSGPTTPQPRELYIEKLVSQARNAIVDLKFGSSPSTLTSVPAGGSFSLVKGSTYYIQMDSYTATQGYEQLETFSTLPNTVFQVLSVTTTYTANSTTHLLSPHDMLYSDACQWESDPGSPNYLSCLASGKIGGKISVLYEVKIIDVGLGSQTINSLIYDLSGASYHYNSDYDSGARTANLIDPSNISIKKSFNPSTTNVGGTSTLIFTITNPNAGAIGGLNFTDDLSTVAVNPVGGLMKIAATPNASTSCGTGATVTAAADGSLISLSNGTVPASGSCTVQVNVTADAEGLYENTSGPLYVGDLNTCKEDLSNVATCKATATLEVDEAQPLPPPPSSCTNPTTLATWTFESGNILPDAGALVSAVASYTTVSGSSSVALIGGQNAWGGTAPTGTDGWNETPTSMNNYFQFELGTTDFGGVTVNFDAGLYGTGDWANPTSPLYVNTKGDGSFSVYESSPGIYPQSSKGAWSTSLFAAAASTGTSTTTFRFSTSGSGNKKPGAIFALDNVIFKGCPRPEPPDIEKIFSPTSVAVGEDSTLTFTISNPNTAMDLSGIEFTDTLPEGLSLVTAGSSTVCGGTLTATPASRLISFTGGTLTRSGTTGASCPISVLVRPTAAGVYENISGTISHTYETVTYTNTTASGYATATLNAVNAPTISKTFVQNPIIVGGVSQLVFAIANPNLDADAVLSGISFTDNLPLVSGNQVRVASSSYDGSTVTVTNGSPNVTGLNTNFQQDYKVGDLVVIGGVASDIASIHPTDQSLTLTAGYAGASATGVPITASASGCGSSPPLTFAPASTATTVSLADGSIAPGATCTVKVNVTAPATGSYPNSVTVQYVLNGTTRNGNTDTDTLDVEMPDLGLAIVKEVGRTSTGPWYNYLVYDPLTTPKLYYRYILENYGEAELNNVYVTDDHIVGTVCSRGTPLPPPAPSNENHLHYCSPVEFTPSAVNDGIPVAATVYGIYTPTSTPLTDTSRATYATAAISLDKRIKAGTPNYFTKAGDTLTYEFVITNTGKAILPGPIMIDDPIISVTCPALSTIGDYDNYLDPAYPTAAPPVAAEVVICTVEYNVDDEDMVAKQVINTAFAYTNPYETIIPSIESNSDTVTVLLAPDLVASKSNNTAGKIMGGGSFVWSLTVRNDVDAGDATFLAGSAILTDNLPTTGVTGYTFSPVLKSGINGPLTCTLASNDLSCIADGGPVFIPSTLTGTISVTNNSTAVTGSGTAFDAELSAGSVILIDGVPYEVAADPSLTATTLTITQPYMGATDIGLRIPGSFTVQITVTTEELNIELANPRDPGICQVDPNDPPLLNEISTDNNTCNDSVEVKIVPVITVIKTVKPYSDPINGTSDPRAIPGAYMNYLLEVKNTGLGSVDLNTTVITDKIPENAELFIGDFAADSGPILFSDQCLKDTLQMPDTTPDTSASGLDYIFTTLTDGVDSLAFSNDPPPTPSFSHNSVVADGDSGCDPTITYFRINFVGIFKGTKESTDNKPTSFCLEYRVRLK